MTPYRNDIDKPVEVVTLRGWADTGVFGWELEINMILSFFQVNKSSAVLVAKLLKRVIATSPFRIEEPFHVIFLKQLPFISSSMVAHDSFPCSSAITASGKGLNSGGVDGVS